MRVVYNLLMPLLVPLLLLRLLWRSRQNPDYRRDILQRLALGLPAPRVSGQPKIWIHAVSVGETLAIAPLIERVLRDLPDHSVLITSTTPTGRDQVARLFANRVDWAWVPFDTSGCVDRFLTHWSPSVIGLVETEIWPQIILRARKRGVPTLLLNARLSHRSARGYARVGGLSRPVIGSLAAIACQSRAHARRFVALGAAPRSVTVAGSVKFDVPVESLRKQQQQLRQHLAISPERPILLAASTHRGEDGWVIDAFLQVLQAVPNALLLLAPRHPERGHEVSALLTDARLAWRLRSQQNPVLPSDQVLLVDTLGELGAMTGLAQIAFIGGSLVAHGGHNPLEAAAFGVPTLTGPHRFNFGDIFSDLLACGGAQEVADANGLARAWIQWLQNPESAQKAGRAAEIYLQKNKGALDAQYALLETHIRGSASVD